jgi:hypothetical protein
LGKSHPQFIWIMVREECGRRDAGFVGDVPARRGNGGGSAGVSALTSDDHVTRRTAYLHQILILIL